jgi:hypothetical protein
VLVLLLVAVVYWQNGVNAAVIAAGIGGAVLVIHLLLFGIDRFVAARKPAHFKVQDVLQVLEHGQSRVGYVSAIWEDYATRRSKIPLTVLEVELEDTPHPHPAVFGTFDSRLRQQFSKGDSLEVLWHQRQPGIAIPVVLLDS